MRATCLRSAASALGLTLAVALTAAEASAGEPPILKVARHESGPYGTTAKISVGPDQKNDFFIKARSPQDSASGRLLHLGSSMELYKTKYFKGNRNITDEVKGPGFEFTLQPTAKKFHALVKDVGNAPDSDCVGVRLEMDPDLSDQAVVGINTFCI